MAVIQVTPVVRGTGVPLSATLVFPSAITAANSVAVLIAQSGVVGRTFSVLEGGSGTGWTNLYNTPGGTIGVSRFWGRANHPGGGTDLVVSHGQNTADYACCAVEFEAGTSLSLVLSDEFVDAAVTDNHKASTSGLTTALEVLGLIAAGAASTNFTNGVATGSWTKIGGTDANYFFAYQLFAGGTSSELGAWDSTGTDRVARSGMVLLGTEAAAPATAQVIGGGWFGL